MPYDNYGGYVLYEPNNPDERYYFDKNPNQMDFAQYNIETSRQQLNTFSRVPYVYYAGHTNFHVVRMDGTFVEGLCQDGSKNNKTSREQVQDFKELLSRRVPLILENSQGEGYVVDVYIDREETPKTHVSSELLDYIIVTIICTEIGKLYNELTVAHRGSGGGDSVVYQDIPSPISTFGMSTFSSVNEIGSGTGQNIEYSIVAKYGVPIELDASAFPNVDFLGWYKNNSKIPELYAGFDDGETLEARFGKIININVQHTGNGTGETQVSQNKEIVGESSGANSYSVSIIDGLPIKLGESYDSDFVDFAGWQDSSGNPLDIIGLQLADGDTIYAKFTIKTASVVVAHKGCVISSTSSQNGNILGTKTGEVVSYNINPEIQGGISITHSTLDSTYEFLSIEDEAGNKYNNGIIPTNKIRQGMQITITYKKSLVGITIKHVGSSGGYTSASQDGSVIDSGSGGSGVSYTFDIDVNKPLDLHGEPQAQEGDMVTVFLGFEYENGMKVDANDTFNGGETIYAVFDIYIDHDFEWLFKVYWDNSLVGSDKVDVDSYAMLRGGALDGLYVAYNISEEDEEGVSRKRVSLDSENSVDLDIDNTRSGSHGSSPEVITVLGKPCDRVEIRLEIYSGEENLNNSGLSDIKVEVFRQGVKFVEHTKDYYIQSSLLGHRINGSKPAYHVCDVDLINGELIDVEKLLESGVKN